ncbi:hypothetical protein, partial [Halomonas sp. 3D7M]|uniref:hypothetical protein n=1 Tax=Halomonas sp. 3D7M TaxID=2742617 RepID=UPI001D021990
TSWNERLRSSSNFRRINLGGSGLLIAFNQCRYWHQRSNQKRLGFSAKAFVYLTVTQLSA